MEKVKVTVNDFDFFHIIYVKRQSLETSLLLGIMLRYSLCNKFGSGFE